MAQFNYLNEMNSALTMDGELSRCPAPRWQKKSDASSVSLNLNGSINTSKLSISYNNNGLSTLAASMSGKTPQKNGTKSKKTPGKSPSKYSHL